MHYIVTLEDALDAHEDALSKGGGRIGLTNLNSLLSALGRPYTGYYPQLPKKAAALLHSMVKNHPFVDANKRTAFLLVTVLAERSGYEINLLDDDDDQCIEDFVVAVAEDELSFEEIAKWYRKRLFRI